MIQKKIISSSPYTLLVFFSPTDCASCLYEKELWKRISKEGKIKIIGIGRHIDRRELKEWVKNSEIDFPVLYDVNSQVTKKFGIRRTPLKVLVDNRGIIKSVDRVRLIPSEQEEFLRELREILNK